MEGELLLMNEKRSMLKRVLSKLDLDEYGRLVLGDTPMVLTTRFFIAQIQKTAEEITGVNGAAALMYRAGFKGGYYFAERQAKLFGLKGFEILEKFISIASVRGWWSKYEIIEFNENPLRVVMRFYNTIAEEWGNVGRAVCHMWRGSLSAIMKYIMDSTGKQVKVVGKETKCMAKGDSYCEIIIEEEIS